MKVLIVSSLLSFALLVTQQSWGAPPLVTLATNSLIGEQSSEVTFYAMGDVPYAPNEDRLLPKQIENLPTDGRFLIHLGDIKNGASPCSNAASIYSVSSGLLDSPWQRVANDRISIFR